MWVTIIILVLLLFIGLKFVRLEHHMKTVKIILIVIVGAMLYFSMSSMFKSDQADFSSPKGVVNSVSIYFMWLKNTVFNLWDVGKETTVMVGNAIKIDNNEEKD